MLQLWKNQGVRFYYKNVLKNLWKSDILSKDTGR